MRRLAIDHEDLSVDILRIIASYIRSSSARMYLEALDSQKKADSDPLYFSTRLDKGEGKTFLEKISENSSMFPDFESSVAAIKDIIKQQRCTFEQVVKQSEEDGEYSLDLSNSIFINGALGRTNLQKTNLSEIYAVNFVLEGTDFSRANMVGAYLKRCSIKQCIFDKVELTDVKMVDLDFSFSGVSFEGANLEKVTFGKCIFDKTNFKSAKVQGCAFVISLLVDFMDRDE